jgi:hypothetical protein
VCIRRIPQLRPGTSARPLFGRDVTQGGENPAQADYGSAITAGVPPYSRRNLATKSRGASSRLSRPGASERQSRAAAPHVAWAGRGGRGPLARTAGERYRGRRSAINCQKFTALCIFKPSRRASLIRPGKNPSAVSREAHEGFWDRLSAAVADRPDGGRGRPVRPPGGTGPESPALPSSGRRPACWRGN